jgi:hypothetical protein
MKRGPNPRIPVVLLELIAAHIEVCQVGVGELSGKDIKRLIGAAISGTPFQAKFNVESVCRKLRMHNPDATQSATKVSVEDARAEWTTFENLDRWFTDAKQDVINSGLVIDETLLDEKGNIISELNFQSDEVRRRFINMDETHHDLSITGDKSGPRAVIYHNPNLQRGGKRAVKNSRHVTGVYATNAAGESIPPMYIYDSGAKHSKNFQVNTSWLEGLPKVTGRYGFRNMKEVDSFYSVRQKGSMDDALLNDYIERVIMPLYPNLSSTAVFSEDGKLIRGPVFLKLDAGPGRIVASEESITRRSEFKEKGLLILMGLPNATAVQQEMDDLYGPFKSATYARAENVVSEKLKERGVARRNGQDVKAIVSLNFTDLPNIVNGKDGDPINERPFVHMFTEAKILHSWEKIGFVPFTRNCLHHPKVRSELGQKETNTDLEELQVRYNRLTEEAEQAGFNRGVFDAEIPVARPVERVDDEDEQVKQLVEQKGAFSASALWNICGTRIGNAAVTLRAQKMLLAAEEEQKAKVAKEKEDANNKKLAKAQSALEKYHSNVNSLTEKDWGDVLRWVLPAAGVSFLVKDYKKKEAIIAKLNSLNEPWTSFIPPRGATLEVAV